jgi:hypothetical protein
MSAPPKRERPKRRVRVSKIEAIRQALRELLAEHQRDSALPTSARFLFYELVQRGIIAKHPSGKRRPDQDMSDALIDIRESGEIPWDWIVDETRSLSYFDGYPSIKEGLLDYLSVIHHDPWDGRPPMILTESRSLAGVLRSLCSEYRVRIAATNGQCGGFLHTVVVPALKPMTQVLYLGDFDLCGNQIEKNTWRVFERKVGELDWERIALTEEQVAQYRLPKITKHDRRYNDGHPHEAVETEALSQNLIVEILRNLLERRLPEPLADVQERAEEQRARLRTLLENLD